MLKRILTLTVVASVALAGYAQNENLKAFKNLGVGLEVGTMGVGLQVACPVVDDHLVLVAGVNTFGSSLISSDFDMSSAEVNKGIDAINKEVDKHNAKPANADKQLPRINHYLPADFSVTADLKLSTNFKLLLEYYPSVNHSFHITGGLMMGNKDFIQLTGKADDQVQALYQEAVSIENKAREAGAIGSDKFIDQKLQYTIDGKTYAVRDRVQVDASVRVMSVKPYLGIGFGRAIPNKRVGFQFEMGAWFHGKPSIESPNQVEYDELAEERSEADDALKTIKSIMFYPQITFRLTGRIF